VKLKLTIDGKVYEVEVEATETSAPQPSYIPPPGRAGHTNSTTAGTASTSNPSSTPTASTVVDEAKVCRSPISGVVVRVVAQVGQEIQVNDVLLVLEAMKMETEISSPVHGQVARIVAQAGESVKAGQVVVEFF
jgi:methylmalonyl-CoA carboxyltransferase small subunit